MNPLYPCGIHRAVVIQHMEQSEIHSKTCNVKIVIVYGQKMFTLFWEA